LPDPLREPSPETGGVVEPVVPTVKEALTDDPFKLAVTLAVPEEVAPVTLTENVAVVWPDATVTEAGLLKVIPLAAVPSETTVPALGAAALTVTVHEVEAGAVNEVGEHASKRTRGTIWMVPVEMGMLCALADAPRAFATTIPEGVPVVEEAS